MLLFAVIVGVLGVLLLGLVALRSRRWLQVVRVRRRATRAAAGAEHRARAVMSELCPHGWQAQITLFEHAGPRAVLADRDGPRGAVALDWAELSLDPSGRPAVMRRVWADTIADALDAMVTDRRTDQALEQIEQLAAAEGALWPDLESGSA